METSAKKQVEIASTSTQSSKRPIIDLEREWEQFKKKLHKYSNLEQTSEIQTPKQTSHKSNLESTEEGVKGTQDVEIIPVTPTSEIVLRVEEIPPLDVFYSPTHKAVVKR